MPVLVVTNVFEAFRFINHPSLKVFRKRIRHKTKHIREKVKKVLRGGRHRVHCKNTPPPKQSATIGVQTSFVSLIEQLSHSGDIDMSHHHPTMNSNQNNSNPRLPFGHGRTAVSKRPSSPVIRRKPGVPMKAVNTSGHTASAATKSHASHHLAALPDRPRVYQLKTSSTSTSTGTYPLTSTGTVKHSEKRHFSNSSYESGYLSDSSQRSSKTTIDRPHSGRQRSNSISEQSSKLRERSLHLKSLYKPEHMSSHKSLTRSNSFSSRSETASPYHPHPPSSSPPSELSPARQRHRVSKQQSKKTTLPSVSPRSPSLTTEHTLTERPLRRSDSMSSLASSIRDIVISSDSDDYLHSKESWGSHQVPDYLKLNSTPTSTKAEETPVISTHSDRRHSIADVLNVVRTTPESQEMSETSKKSRVISPTGSFLKMLKSIKLHQGKRRSVNTQVSCGGIEELFLHGGIVGLSNIGNTCFMNSMIHCLSHSLEMTQAFLQSESPLTNGSVCIAYSSLIRDIWSPKRTNSPFHARSSDATRTVAPRRLKDTIARVNSMFAGYSQQDSQEFLRVLVSELHEEMKPSKKSKMRSPITGLNSRDPGEEAWQSYFHYEDTPISRVFMGQLKSTLTCDVCKGSSLTFDPFWDLALPLPKTGSQSTSEYKGKVTLEDCLDLFTRMEIMDGDNKPCCATCRKCQRSSKQMTVHRFPPVLVLHLKRFSGFRYRVKLNTSVDIPQMLDLTKYASKETASMKYKGRKVTYELYAVSNHCGGASFGHYTAWAKHYATQQWYTFNDSSVYKHSSVSPTAQNRFTSQEAYVLFYRRSPIDNV